MSELALPQAMPLNKPQYASLGLSGLSALANTFASHQQQRGVDAAAEQQRGIQQAYTGQARDALQSSIQQGGFAGQQAQTADLQKALTARFQGAQKGAGAGVPIPGSGGAAVVAEEGRARGEASDYAGQQAAGQAGLAALKDANFRTGIGLDRNAQAINQINQQRSFAMAPLGAELAAANTSGWQTRGLADLAQLGATAYGARGAADIQAQAQAEQARLTQEAVMKLLAQGQV